MIQGMYSRIVAFSLFVFIFGSHALANQAGCILPEKPKEYFDRSLFALPEVRASWDIKRFSDPVSHNSQSFRYLVHTIDSAVDNSLGGNPKPKYSVEETFRFITKNVSQNPCAFLSMSLINQDRTGTFGVVGFIFKVPQDNMIVASPRDIGSKNLSVNQDNFLFNRTAKEYAQQIPMTTPEQILLDTEKGSWNEMVVQGKVHDPIVIAGVVINYKNFQNGILMSYQTQMVEDIKRFAAKENLPIVIIGEPVNF